LQRRIVAQDPAVEFLELLAGQEADLVEHPAALVEGGVGLDVAAGLVEREHQVTDELLAVTVQRDETLELQEDLGVVPELELGADALLERVQPPLLQMADLGLHALFEGEVRERLAAPEGERLSQRRGALRRSLGPRPPRRAARIRRDRAAPGLP
jgi:hypothetical protein